MASREKLTGPSPRAQEKMTQHLVWDSPVCLVGAVPQRVKLVLWLGSPEGRCEPAGTRLSMPQSSEVWGKNGTGKVWPGSRVQAQLFFFFCLV